MNNNKFNNNEISMYLSDIKEYVKSTLTYLKNENNNNIDKDEIFMYLSSVPEIIDDIKVILVNYLYYLEDKIDDVYKNEVDKSIYKLIVELTEVDYNE